MFAQAKPIWAAGREKESNLFLKFTFSLPESACLIRLTASTAYHLTVDGRWITYGPARAGEGYFRVDEWPVEKTGSEHAVEILAAGYYLSCFEYALWPSFLQCEALDAAGGVVFATGRDAVRAVEYGPRLRRTDKFSRQRVYSESYDFRLPDGPPLPLGLCPEPGYLPRRVPAFSHRFFAPAEVIARQNVTWAPASDQQGSPFDNASMRHTTPLTGLLGREECLYREAERLRFAPAQEARVPGELAAGQATLCALDRIRAGMLEWTAEAEEESEVMFLFDEILLEGDIVFHRINALNAVKVILPAGKHAFRSFEPYTFKYLKICVLRGRLKHLRLGLREEAGPELPAVSFGEKELQDIYDAAVNTFRQNATDIFMDCPSRERAGWLCDSFFTARTEYALTGGCTVETNFLENFLRNTGFRYDPPAPAGMLPMCYPSSHDFSQTDKNYISTWAMWFVIELEEYRNSRGGDAKLAANLKDKVYAMLAGLRGFENEDGLLEDLPGWVFVEWSRANDADVVAGVNYPVNMVYAGALKAAGILYADEALLQKAAALRKEILRQSFNGRFFADNARRENGCLKRTDTTTEVCQYYAFFFDIASDKTHPGLLRMLRTEFGPGRKEKDTHPDVPFANAFIGNYLRLDILFRYGFAAQVQEEIRGYFGDMARKTGSLWEFDRPQASCCHGFASYVAYWCLATKDALEKKK